MYEHNINYKKCMLKKHKLNLKIWDVRIVGQKNSDLDIFCLILITYQTRQETFNFCAAIQAVQSR